MRKRAWIRNGSIVLDVDKHGRGWWISVHPNDDTMSDDEQEKIAALIAAAPQLLAACKQAEKVMASTDNAPTRWMLQEVIAKAERREPPKPPLAQQAFKLAMARKRKQARARNKGE